jgi:hypothetical protein
MRVSRWLQAGLFVGAAVLIGPASPARAGIEQGSCDGNGTFLEGGFTIDARTAGDTVFTVPRKDTVSWEGSVPAAPGAYSGSIKVDLPPPFGSVTIDSWSGDSETTSNTGVEEYDLPSLVPAGVEFRVSGEHRDDNGTCSGYVLLEIDGGPFDSPVAPVSLALTAASGAGFFAAIRPLFRRVV